jgi:metal-sulfur cluster biosynthetic enzyme
MSSALDAEIGAALERVCDPCSIAARAPISIVDMGLVRGWSVDEGGNLIVRLCVTSAGCTMAPHMVRAAEAELTKMRSLSSVRVEVDASAMWTPAAMTERGRSILEARREASMRAVGTMPQQWRRSV